MSRDTALSPERFRSLRARVRGTELVCLREGPRGAPLLLIHGWPQTRRVWWRNAQPLADAGFDVIAPDLRGFGESASAPGSDGSIAAHSSDLYALLRDRLGLERASVVAGGLGGLIAQDLSARFPGFVERLVLFACPLPGPRHGMRREPCALPPEKAPDSARMRRSFAASFYTAGRRAGREPFSAEELSFLLEPFGAGAWLRAGSLACESAGRALLLESNPTPCVLLRGDSDPWLAPDWDELATRAFEDAVGPLLLPATGHFVQWEAADALNDAIVRAALPAAPSDWPDAETAYVALGSNLGSRERHLCAAVAALRASEGVRSVVVSPVYETRPLGPGAQGPYLNAVARLETRQSPRALLGRLLEIERKEGRERSGPHHAPRTLDLDLLLYGSRQIDEPGLEVPHPRLHERSFVLEPLRDLAPRLIHPRLGESIEALARRVRDPKAVRRRE